VYTIDDQLPMIQFSEFSTVSTICPISVYELYESKNDISPHSGFGNATIENGNVQFTLNENTLTSL